MRFSFVFTRHRILLWSVESCLQSFACGGRRDPSQGPPKVQCCPKLVPLSSTEEPLPLEVDTILRPHTCHGHLTVGMKKINYHQRCTPLHCRKTYIEPLEKQWSLDMMMIIGGAEKAIYGI